MVCTVDETGQLQTLIDEQEADEGVLSETDMMQLRTDIVNFLSRFDPVRFSSAYDFKYETEGTVLNLANINVLEIMDSLNRSGEGSVNTCRAPESGVVSYTVDGYEDMSPEDITGEFFSEEYQYQKKQLMGVDLVTQQDPIYKLSTDENWSVVIPVDRERAALLEEEEYVQVRFLKTQDVSWGEVAILDKGSSGLFAQLSFNNSMIAFAGDRFLDIELILDSESGLKVPNTAITTKEFFLVGRDYVTRGGNSGEYGVLRETTDENGNLTVEFVPTQIYQETEEEYYLDNSNLRVGDHLQKPDSTDTFTVSKSATLVGVYNINKGYADFKEIQVLYQNDEYSIIRSNTTYGLSAYDHIVLDAETVDLNELIYE